MRNKYILLICLILIMICANNAQGQTAFRYFFELVNHDSTRVTLIRIDSLYAKLDTTVNNDDTIRVMSPIKFSGGIFELNADSLRGIPADSFLTILEIAAQMMDSLVNYLQRGDFADSLQSNKHTIMADWIFNNTLTTFTDMNADSMDIRTMMIGDGVNQDQCFMELNAGVIKYCIEYVSAFSGFGTLNGIKLENAGGRNNILIMPSAQTNYYIQQNPTEYEQGLVLFHSEDDTLNGDSRVFYILQNDNADKDVLSLEYGFSLGRLPFLQAFPDTTQLKIDSLVLGNGSPVYIRPNSILITDSLHVIDYFKSDAVLLATIHPDSVIALKDTIASVVTDSLIDYLRKENFVDSLNNEHTITEDWEWNTGALNLTYANFIALNAESKLLNIAPLNVLAGDASAKAIANDINLQVSVSSDQDMEAMAQRISIQGKSDLGNKGLKIVRVQNTSSTSGDAIAIEILDDISSTSGDAYVIKSLAPEPSWFEGSIFADSILALIHADSVIGLKDTIASVVNDTADVVRGEFADTASTLLKRDDFRDSLGVVLPAGNISQDSMWLYLPFDEDSLDYSEFKTNPTSALGDGVHIKTDPDSLRIGGGAGYFDGSDALYVSDANVQDGSDEISLGCWIKFPVGTSSSARPIIFKGNNSDLQYQLSVGSSQTVTFTTYAAGGSSQLSASASAVSNGWHHIAATVIDSTRLNVYVDGILAASDLTPSAQIWNKNGNGLLRLMTNLTASSFSIGTIDEVFIYNRLLDSLEVQQLYYNSAHFHDNLTKENKYATGDSLAGYPDTTATFQAITDTADVVRGEFAAADLLKLDKSAVVDTFNNDHTMTGANTYTNGLTLNDDASDEILNLQYDDNDGGEWINVKRSNGLQIAWGYNSNRKSVFSVYDSLGATNGNSAHLFSDSYSNFDLKLNEHTVISPTYSHFDGRVDVADTLEVLSSQFYHNPAFAHINAIDTVEQAVAANVAEPMSYGAVLVEGFQFTLSDTALTYTGNDSLLVSIIASWHMESSANNTQVHIYVWLNNAPILYRTGAQGDFLPTLGREGHATCNTSLRIGNGDVLTIALDADGNVDVENEHLDWSVIEIRRWK